MNYYKAFRFTLTSLLLFFYSIVPARVPVWTPNNTSDFEVNTQVRAWDLHDLGMSHILDYSQQVAGVNSIYMVVVPHSEGRPFQAPQFPFNPKRNSIQAEDARVFFLPEMSRYGVVKPQQSSYSYLAGIDWLKIMIDSCRARGIGAAAEVSHNVLPQGYVNSHPEVQQKDKSGNQINSPRPCPNSPNFQQYAVALFGDLAKNYDLDYIQSATYLFSKGKYCYCQHCTAASGSLGLNLNDTSEMEKFRRISTTKFFSLISNEIKRVKKNPKCHFRYNDIWRWENRTDPHATGLYLDSMLAVGAVGSVVIQDHTEQLGRGDEDFDLRDFWLTENRSFIGANTPLICSFAPRMAATPTLVKAGIKVAVQHSSNIHGLALKHLDGTSFGLMRASKQGMIDAGVQGLTPTIGKEVEDMTLSGFTKFVGSSEYVEDEGARTTSTGTATYTFQGPTNNYKIRLTYFDEENGKSPVKLFINGALRDSFNLDEETDCWRWRTFKGIYKVNTGDQIKLEAVAKGSETPRLDYLEFLPQQIVSINHPFSNSTLAQKNTKGFQLELRKKADRILVSKPNTFYYNLHGKQLQEKPDPWKLFIQNEKSLKVK